MTRLNLKIRLIIKAISTINTKSAKNVSYKKFIEDITNFSNQLNIDKNQQLNLAQIEMAIFAFSGYYWKTRKTATKEFKLKEINNHKDFEEALRIANKILY